MLEHTPPTRWDIVRAIAGREIAIASKRKLVRLLFLGSLIPPLVLGVFLVVKTLVEGAGFPLPWDPLARFIEVQLGPVLLLALAVGTPSVARDRGEDVLFLYATRPVTPWSYTWGKMLAVAAPCVGLLLLPGVLIAALRLGLLTDVGVGEAADLLLRVALVAVFMAIAYAGLCVGASAAAKKARWALVTAFSAIMIPSLVASFVWRRDQYPLDAANAAATLAERLFAEPWDSHGTVALLVLLAWAALGSLVTATTVRREMRP